MRAPDWRVPIERALCPVLVGRDDELRILEEALQAAQRRGEEIEERQPGYGPTLLRSDTRRFLEAIWALVFEGVLMVGMNEDNAQWPWLSLTQYGPGGRKRRRHRAP